MNATRSKLGLAKLFPMTYAHAQMLDCCDFLRCVSVFFFLHWNAIKFFEVAICIEGPAARLDGSTKRRGELTVSELPPRCLVQTDLSFIAYNRSVPKSDALTARDCVYFELFSASWCVIADLLRRCVGELGQARSRATRGQLGRLLPGPGIA